MRQSLHVATPTKEQLTERAQLVRLYEASCKIDYPTPLESRFRLAVMKKLGLAYALRGEPKTVEAKTSRAACPHN